LVIGFLLASVALGDSPNASAANTDRKQLTATNRIGIELVTFNTFPYPPGYTIKSAGFAQEIIPDTNSERQSPLDQ
jgi:hypothetical protein